MNIAIVCHDHRPSGANLSLIDWLKDVNRDEINLTVVLPRYHKQFIDMLRTVGIKDIIIGHYVFSVKKLYKPSIKDFIKDLIKLAYAAFFNKFMYNIVAFKLKKRNIILIHTNSFATMAGAYISKKINVPHIFHVREFMEEDHQFTHYKQEKVKKYCENSYAIFISDVICHKYLEKYKFIDYIILYDQIFYESSYKKEKKFLENETCNMIFVGTLAKNKGHIDALNCLKKMNETGKNANLYICGVGPYGELLRTYVKDHNINGVYFLGYRKDTLELRKKMDIAFMCSSQEALGRVTVEAQYYENLVIGANCGCTPYLIENKKTGLLYCKNIEDDLYNKVIYAINHKAEMERIIDCAKKKSINKFSGKIAHKIFDFYSEILSGK